MSKKACNKQVNAQKHANHIPNPVVPKPQAGANIPDRLQEGATVCCAAKTYQVKRESTPDMAFFSIMK